MPDDPHPASSPGRPSSSEQPEPPPQSVLLPPEPPPPPEPLAQSVPLAPEPPAPAADDVAGTEELAARAHALADGIEATLATWVVRCVLGVAVAWQGEVDPDVMVAAEEAGERARVETGAAVRSLLEADIDRQDSTPLTLVRAAVRYPTEVLAAAGVPEVERDSFAEAAFPDDVYDLSPASFADVDPSLAEVGIAWGAAKAWVHRRRHTPGGRGGGAAH